VPKPSNRTSCSDHQLITSNPDFKVTPLFNAEYLRNGKRYRHSYSEIPIGTYALLNSVISNDLERPSEIVNVTMQCAVSLRHLSILSVKIWRFNDLQIWRPSAILCFRSFKFLALDFYCHAILLRCVHTKVH